MPSLDEIYVLSNGLLLATDQLSLSSDLVIDSPFLADTATSTRHQIHTLAEQAFQALIPSWLCAQQWVMNMQASGMSKENIKEVISFLQIIGGLRVHRSTRGSLEMILYQAARLSMGSEPVLVTGRFPAGTRGITLASLKATTLLWFITPLSACLAYAVHIITYQELLSTPIILVLLVSGMILHELAHAEVIRPIHPAICILQRGMKLGVLHPPLPWRVDLRAALAGPCVGAISTIALGFLAAYFLGIRWLSVVSLTFAVFHFFSLAPFQGDGRALIHALKVSRHERKISP